MFCVDLRGGGGGSCNLGVIVGVCICAVLFSSYVFWGGGDVGWVEVVYLFLLLILFLLYKRTAVLCLSKKNNENRA